MKRSLYKQISSSIKANSGRYIALAIIFIIGIAAGAFAIKGLSADQIEELDNYFNGFLQLSEKEEINSSELFFTSFFDNLKFVLVLWLAGITIIGIPFIYMFIGFRGFITGFSSGFFINSLGFKGTLFSMVSIIPGELIIAPCYIILAANGILFSMSIIKSRSIRGAFRKNIRTELTRYSLVTLLIGIASTAGVLINSYVSPVFLRILLPMLTST